MRKFDKFNKSRYSTDRDTYRMDRPMSPKPETVGEPTQRGISEWTVRQYGNKLNLAPISLLLDPTKEAIEVAQPYPIINSNNPTLERKYIGKPTTNGLVLNDIMINPYSNLVHEFDSGKLEIDLAYQYLNVGAEEGKTVQPYRATNYQYQKAFDEGRARVQAELWMSSSFNTSIFKSNIPYMEDSMTSAFIYYQTFLQNMATVMAKFNQLTLLQQDLINMGYQRESSMLVELFSKLGKTTFLNKWFTLAADLKDEYFDTAWFQYVNGITNVPARKSNSTRDPLLTVVGVHQMPQISISLADNLDPYFESNKFKVKTYSYKWNEDKKEAEPHKAEVGLEEFFRNTLRMLDQNNILNWARKHNMGDKDDLFTDADTPNKYANMLDWQVDSLITAMRYFKKFFREMKVFLHIARRSNLIKWNQGTDFSLYKAKATTSAVNNINIKDIIVATCASPSRMVFNPTTQKWGFYSLWDEYEGIPTFDTSNGGMDIIFSVKRDVAGIDFLSVDSIELCLPYLFKHTDDKQIISMINREGRVISINTTSLTGEEVSTNISLSRLIPKPGLLQAPNLGLLKVPNVTIPVKTGISAAHVSAVVRLLTNLFKFGNVDYNSEGPRTFINPSLVCLVDGEMESASIETVKYMVSNAPLTGIRGIK